MSDDKNKISRRMALGSIGAFLGGGTGAILGSRYPKKYDELVNLNTGQMRYGDEQTFPTALGNITIQIDKVDDDHGILEIWETEPDYRVTGELESDELGDHEISATHVDDDYWKDLPEEVLLTLENGDYLGTLHFNQMKNSDLVEYGFDPSEELLEETKKH